MLFHSDDAEPDQRIFPDVSGVAGAEYGLVGGYNGYFPGTSGKGKIFDVHPEWVAKKLDGTEVNSVGHYWMAPSRPEVRQFLLELHREVAQKYDKRRRRSSKDVVLIKFLEAMEKSKTRGAYEYYG